MRVLRFFLDAPGERETLRDLLYPLSSREQALDALRGYLQGVGVRWADGNGAVPAGDLVDGVIVLRGLLPEGYRFPDEREGDHDELAFSTGQGLCYYTEGGSPYTRSDLLALIDAYEVSREDRVEIGDGQVREAVRLAKVGVLWNLCEWQSPETLLDEERGDHCMFGEYDECVDALIEHMWEQLLRVRADGSGRLLEDFRAPADHYHWPKGASVEDARAWFAGRHSKGYRRLRPRGQSVSGEVKGGEAHR